MRLDRERFGRRCDAVVHAGMVALLIFTPLAFGAVHPGPLVILQLAVAGLVVVWALKVVRCGSTSEANERLRGWRWPLIAFGAVAVGQLFPLPPFLLRLLSPHTEAIYRTNLDGWPAHAPFAAVVETAGALAHGVDPAAAADPLIVQAWTLARRPSQSAAWRPLSVYTYRTVEELLLMLTWAAVFFCSSDTHGNRLTARLFHRTRPTAACPTTGSLRGCAPGWL
ncbi:MAG TPA: hypothetical protein VMW17_19975 [Candidatus Binatia bacterium]|nr:hypothetical protein [Candidatus Binatia bacterium]